MHKEKIVFSKKIVEKEYQDIFDEVLEKFPEFKTICIFVKELSFHVIQHTLRAYAPLLSLTNPKRRRVYPIVINSNTYTPVLFKTLTRDEKIGAMAHEFGHIMEYTNKNSFQIIMLTLSFLISKKFVRNFEKRADLIAIKRGFGKQLMSYREKTFIKDIKLSGYRNFIYLKPEDIEKSMKQDLQKSNELSFKIEAQQINNLKKKTVQYTLFHNIGTFYSFFPSIWQMIVLIYYKKVHKTGHF